MNGFENLKDEVKEQIKENDNNEITGSLLQSALLKIISAFGENKTFAGVAYADTNPMSPDSNIFYIAAESGVYNNFRNNNTPLVVEKGEIALLHNGSENWGKITVLQLDNTLGNSYSKGITQESITNNLKILGYQINKEPIKISNIEVKKFKTYIYPIRIIKNREYKISINTNTNAPLNIGGVRENGGTTTFASFGTGTGEITVKPTEGFNLMRIYYGAGSIEGGVSNVVIEQDYSSNEKNNLVEAVGEANNKFADPFFMKKGDFSKDDEIRNVTIVGNVTYKDKGIELEAGAFWGCFIDISKIGYSTDKFMNALFKGTISTGAKVNIASDSVNSGSYDTTYNLTTDKNYKNWLSTYNVNIANPKSGYIRVTFDNRSSTEKMTVENFYMWIGKDVKPIGLLNSLIAKMTTYKEVDVTKFVEREYIFKAKENDVILAKTTGAITSTGTVNNDANYKRTTVTNSSVMLEVKDGEKYYYTGEIDNASYAGAVFKSEIMATLGVAFRDTKKYERVLVDYPVGTKFIGFCSKGDFAINKETEVIKSTLLPSESIIVYVDINNVDSGEGTLLNPFKSINDAIRYIADKGRGVIEIVEGDYREQMLLGLLKTGDFIIKAREANRVRILGSNKLEGWIKTVGRQNTYEIDFTGSVINMARMGGDLIFEDNNPSKLIEERHYHPLQKNLRYRLPFTPLYKKNTIDEVDSNKGTFCVENGKMYIHTTNSDDPETNGFSYENITRSANTYIKAQNQRETVNLTLDNLQFMFTASGFIANGFNTIVRKKCVSLCCNGAGAFQNFSGYVETWFEESGFCNNDGNNSHYAGAFSDYASKTDNRSAYPTVVHNYLWTHDSGDDGESSHEHHNVVLNNCLLEFNGDSGSRPSNDATYYAVNCIFRNNGWEVTQNGVNVIPSRGGEGFSVVNPISNPNRMGCRAVLFNCVSEENNVGYATISQDSNIIEIINCISRNNNTELYAGKGKMIVRNCKSTNSDESKIKVELTGSIQVLNDKEVL